MWPGPDTAASAPEPTTQIPVTPPTTPVAAVAPTETLGQPPVGAAPEPGPVAGQPLPVPGDAGGTGRRFPGWLIPAVVGVVVLVGVAVIAMSFLGSGSAAGASSPEDALDGMVAALDAEDGLGLVSIVDLEDFGLVSDAIDGGGSLSDGIPGVELTVTGLDGGEVTATFRDLGGADSGLRVASIDGMRMTLSRTDDAGAGVLVFDREQVQVFSTGDIDAGSELELTMTPQGTGFEVVARGTVNGERIDGERVDSDGVPMEIVFIENDGRWFFSLGYTIANLAVRAGAVDEPDWGRWRQVLAADDSGGDTPVDAVTRLVQAVPDLDLEDAVLAMDPVETKLLHDFLPVILRAIDEPRRDALEGGRITVDVLDLSEEIDGDTADVFIERVVLRAVDDFGDETTVELDGDWCYRFEDRFDVTRGCLDDDLVGLQRDLDDAVFDAGLDFDLDLAELLPDRPFVRAQRRDGNWYFSPLGTIFAYGASLDQQAGSLLADLQAEVGNDAGVILVDAVATGGTTTVEVPPGGSAGVAIAFSEDDFDEVAGGQFELALAAVTFETDARVELQHNVQGFGDQFNTLRLQPGERHGLVASVSGDESPRTQGAVFRNDGDQTATVTVSVVRVPHAAIDPGGTVTGVIDDEATPWFVDVTGSATIDGAQFAPLDGPSRFPWIEVDRTEGTADDAFVLVVGAPGSEFTIRGN